MCPSCWKPNPEHIDDELTEAEEELFLRVARSVARDVQKSIKTDHYAMFLSSIKSQVPTAYLIEKYSVLPSPESIKNQESKKSPKEIIIIKREQDKDAMDKEVCSQGQQKERPNPAASGSAQPPSKDDHQSSKKPRESDAYASKQHPDH
ncbi:hypothetical protein Tco_1203640 [Tanacetum coccineum]